MNLINMNASSILSQVHGKEMLIIVFPFHFDIAFLFHLNVELQISLQKWMIFTDWPSKLFEPN